MNMSKKDIPYLIAAIGLAVVAALAVGNLDNAMGLYSLVGLFGSVAVMAILINPSLGANIIVISIFANVSANFTDQGLPGIIKPLVVVVFVAILIRNYFTGQIPVNRPKTSRIEAFLIIFFFAVTASYLVASNKNRALEGILDLVKDVIIIYCILFALRRPNLWRQTIWLIILITTILCLLGVYQSISGNYQQDFFGFARAKIEPNGFRNGGPIHEPNMWAQVLAAVVPLVIFRIIHEPRKVTKLLGAAMLIIILIDLLNTYSRGGYVALGVAVILTLFVFEKRFNPMVAFAVLGVIILLLPFLPASYLVRFNSLASLNPTTENGIYQDSSFVGRSSEVLSGLLMFAKHPILGIGVANYENNYQKYAQLIGLEFRNEERQAHSLYVEVLSETGIIGIISFLGIIASLFTGLSRAKKNLKNSPYDEYWSPHINAVMVSLITYLFAGIFLHGAFIRYFWILAAMGITAIQLTDELLIRYKQSPKTEVLF